MRLGIHVITTAKGGELIAMPTCQSAKTLHAEKEDFFFQNEEDVQVEFTRNDKKEVNAFILHQGGSTFTCKKIK